MRDGEGGNKRDAGQLKGVGGSDLGSTGCEYKECDGGFSAGDSDEVF